jgi:hypothetical protein
MLEQRASWAEIPGWEPLIWNWKLEIRYLSPVPLLCSPIRGKPEVVDTKFVLETPFFELELINIDRLGVI